jgi:hypothetical protein
VGRNVADAHVSTSRTSSQRHVNAVIDDHRNRERHQGASSDEQVARIQILESKLDHGRTAAHGRACTLAQSIDAVPKVVSDGDQS